MALRCFASSRQKHKKIRKKNFADIGDRTRDPKVQFQFDLGISKISILGKFFDQVPTTSNTSDCFHIKVHISADISIGAKFWCP